MILSPALGFVTILLKTKHEKAIVWRIDAARGREEIKECLTTVKRVFFYYQEGSLGDHRAYKPYTLLGPPALRLVLDPLADIFFDNRLCMYGKIENSILILRCQVKQMTFTNYYY